MVDDAAPAADGTSRCPWCSAVLPSSDAVACSSCGATLVSETDAQLPGVTALDAEAIARAARQPTPQRRNRLLSWISGEYDPGDEPPAPPGSIAPPAPDVMREMLRLELEAEVANLQGEAGAILAEAEVDAAEAVEDEAVTSTGAESGPVPDGAEPAERG